MSTKLLSLLADSFWKILPPGLAMTIPLTLISFAFALVIATATALIQYNKVPVLTPLARFYIWIVRGTPLLVQLYVIFFGLPRVGVVVESGPSYELFENPSHPRTRAFLRLLSGETSDKENEFKLTALLLAALLLISLLTACGQKQAETEPTGDQLARIQQSGTIIVAMEGTWAPWTYHDESDTLTGYDVDVARAIAEQLGVEVTFVEGDDSAAFLAAINDALAKLSADGTLSELSTKYFGMDITKITPNFKNQTTRSAPCIRT